MKYSHVGIAVHAAEPAWFGAESVKQDSQKPQTDPFLFLKAEEPPEKSQISLLAAAPKGFLQSRQS